MQPERLTDQVHADYDPLYLPNLLRGQSPNARILVINTTTAESASPVSDWIYRNFGLNRYEDILTIEKRAAYERQFEGILDGNSVLLTTGSLADLGREYLYPWIRDFRENVLRTVIEDQIPLLGPCFGMAQLARLYGEGYEDTFPKGVRVLSRRPIQVTGQHSVFHGLTNLTGYCHHNGSVPPSLIERYGQEITVHAITRHPETNLVIPALLTFGGRDVVIGSQFHREILDQEAYSFYERRVLNIIDQIFSLPAEILLVAQSSLQSVHDEASGLSIEELKSLLTSESLEKFNLGHLQQYINFLNQQGKNIRNVEWIKGYIDGTSLLGDEDYNPY
ncbi:MAG: hypothetical protein U9Q67_01630, partial [Patescibacteria group bacterium]|nr:hypothetical protein [Patescibacteria group bacterium]